MSNNILFKSYDLTEGLRSNLQRARQDVDEIPEQRFVNASDDEIVDHVYSKREVVPLALQEEATAMNTRESEVDVRHDFRRAVFDTSRPCMVAAVEVTVSIPFTGSPDLWNCRPNRWSMNPPRAKIRSAGHDVLSGFVEIVVDSPADTVGDGSQLKREVDNTIQSIKQYLENIRSQVDTHAGELKEAIRQQIGSRRERLGKHAAITKVFDIPLQRNPDAPAVSPLPMMRKLVRPIPSASSRPPEPGIRTEDYEHILDVIRHEGRTFEATPETFSKFDEEELRNVILAHLNGHYKGGATGETFRKSGKTDIRIEDGNRAAFVAECKVWRGAAEIGDALDQLLGYLTWRDCKAALVVFNKDVAGFSALQKKLEDVINEHANRERQLTSAHPGEWRFEFHSAEDKERKVDLHVFVFNLFVPRSTA